MGKMIRVQGEMPILKLSGNLHGNKSLEFAQKLKQLCRENSRIEVDIREVEFFDSAMMGVLISQALLFSKQQREMDIIITDDEDAYINELIDVTNLDNALENIQNVIRRPRE